MYREALPFQWCRSGIVVTRGGGSQLRKAAMEPAGALGSLLAGWREPNVKKYLKVLGQNIKVVNISLQTNPTSPTHVVLFII